MSYQSIADFLEDIRDESDRTLRLLDVIPDASLAFRPIPDVFSIGELAWHFSDSWLRMAPKLSISLPIVPRPLEMSSAELRDAYVSVVEGVVTAALYQISDRMLTERRDIYGEAWTIGHALSVMIHHEVHHRGQLSLLMKLAGLSTVKIYG